MRSRQPRMEPTWVEFPSARRQEAQRRAAEFSDLMSQFNELLTASLTEGMSRLLGGMASPQPRTPTKRYRDCECDDDDCERCAPDPCHCRCCIGDADLVVYARAGERRIVPVVISNCRRRDREINLELSQWTTRGGKPTQVTAQIQEPTKFTLKACEEHTVLIGINATVAPTDSPGSTPNRLPDVDECLVLYADLRVEGCDIRPIRIALALLPFDCGAFEVECCCTCC